MTPFTTLAQEADWRSSVGSFNFVDVGSRNGFHDMRLLHPLIRMYSLDADTTVADSGSGFASFQHFPLALHSSAGEVDLYVTEQPGMTSLLVFDEPTFVAHFGLMPGSETWRRGLTTVRVQKATTVRADDFFREQNLDSIDFLKLDTQGTELEILKGAQEHLAARRVSVIKTEVSFHAVYRGQCVFSDVDTFLKSFGYVFVDCVHYPDAVFPSNRQKAVADVALEESLRFSAVGDAIYVLDPVGADQDPATSVRAAVILNQLGYVSMAYRFLVDCGLPTKAAVRLLQATAAGPTRKTRLKRLLQEQLPPWLFRRALGAYRSLFPPR